MGVRVLVDLGPSAEHVWIRADYRRWRLIRNLDDDFLGDYTFAANKISSNQTACGSAQCGTGNAVADLLRGYYSTAAGYVPGPLSPTNQAGNPQTHIFSYFAPYAQDDLKMTERLTLNLGLRWDFRAAAYELNNHFFWLDTTNPQGGLCYADPTLTTDGIASGSGAGGVPILRYCGKDPHPGSKTPFAPRLKFAYRFPGDKTLIRGGYGIFWDSSEGREIDDSGDIYPYSIRNSLSPATNAAAPTLTNNLFPAYPLGPFPVSSLTFLAVIESENPLNPYVQQRSLSIERQLTHGSTVEVNYIGTKGTHLLDRRDIAQPFGQWFNRNETWAEQAQPWITYLARNSYLLQQGQFVADVAYFYGEDSNVTATFGSKAPDVPVGYNYDFVNADALEHKLSVKGGKLVTESGMQYRALVLDPFSARMSLPVLRRVRELVRSGATVIGKAPVGTPSLADDQAAYTKIVAELWGAGSSVGSGKVLQKGTVAEALTEAGIAPDFSFSKPQPDSEVDFVHRRTPGRSFTISTTGATGRRRSTRALR